MDELQGAYQIVEECIQRLGVDPASCRGELEGQWNLQKGSAKVWIDVYHIPREQRSYFQVMSPMMPVPSDANLRNELFAELLNYNDHLFGVCFATKKNTVWLKVIREVSGLDADEAFNMITRIGNYSDYYDDKLIAKYGPRTDGGGVEPGRPPEA